MLSTKLMQTRVNNFTFKTGKYAGCKLADVAEDARGKKYLQVIIENKKEEIELLEYAIKKAKSMKNEKESDNSEQE